MSAKITWKMRPYDEKRMYAVLQRSFLCFVLSILFNSKIGFFASCFLFWFTYTLFAGSKPPINNPAIFREWVIINKQQQQSSNNQRRIPPTLLCLGDSLTHGHSSANFTQTDIPFQLIKKILEPNKKAATIPTTLTISNDTPFIDPIWVVNAGQNGATSYYYLHERLRQAFHNVVSPDYVLLLLGSNDVLSMWNDALYRRLHTACNMPPNEPMNMISLERNLKAIIRFILQRQPKVPQLGVCTLPPIGEDLHSRSNVLVRQANQIIEKIVSESWGNNNRISIIPVYAAMEALLEKKENQRKKKNNALPVTNNSIVFLHVFACTFRRMFSVFGVPWNFFSKIGRYQLTSDGIHLNELSRDIVVDLIVDWLIVKDEGKTRFAATYMNRN